jgi:hypothetical protein
MRLDVPSAIAVTLLSSACANRVETPENTLVAYVNAVENRDWRRAYALVGPDVQRGMSTAEFVEFCEENASLLSDQASHIEDAVARGQVSVRAELPLDRVRSVDTLHVEGRWLLADQVPLLDGSDSPTDSMSALAAALQSDGVVELLSLLSEDAEGRYLAEIDAIVEALIDAGERQLSVYGDTASISIGEITISLIRESGAWQVSSVSQHDSYDSYDYYDW